MSGSFGNIGGQSRAYIARLDATTGTADSFNPQPSGGGFTFVYAISVQADGKILAGGDFGTIGGQTRSRIARLDATTGTADSFNPNVSGSTFPAVFAITVQADGKILTGGEFTTFSPNGGASVTRNYIARLETDGRADQTLDLSIVGSSVVATALQPDGKILIGGSFTNVLGVKRNDTARLNRDGTLDLLFNPDPNGEVYAIAVQADGKILIGGSFNTVLGVARTNIARLNSDGTLDTAFYPAATDIVESIAVQADGKILIGGVFTGLVPNDGVFVTRNRIARLNPDGTLDTAFNPDANYIVESIVVQADGKILTGGNFTSIGGQTRNFIARVDATTGAADSFDPNANNEVFSIAVQADGKILVGGFFSGGHSIGGQTRNRIARLDPTTGAPDSFDPNANSFINAIAVQADGRIVVGGDFINLSPNGGAAVTRNRIARLNPDGTLDTAFDPNANDTVNSIAVQADGKILPGGDFNSIGGQSRSRFARLLNNTAALQNLAVSQITVNWTLAGSSPHFARVTFEYSTDNVSYNLLGNGIRQGGSGTWTLTGLNLPTGTNLYIRARGFHRGGYLNGSESIAESVRNAYLTPQPLLTIQRSANTNVVLSWATNFTGFTLEANTNLHTSVWSVVSLAPAVSGTNNVVTNAASGSTSFYRLRQ